MAHFKEVNVLNPYHCEDLIAFGINNNIPEAIKLGERTLQMINGQVCPEVAKSLKQYKLEHNEKY